MTGIPFVKTGPTARSIKFPGGTTIIIGPAQNRAEMIDAINAAFEKEAHHLIQNERDIVQVLSEVREAAGLLPSDGVSLRVFVDSMRATIARLKMEVEKASAAQPTELIQAAREVADAWAYDRPTDKPICRLANCLLRILVK